MKKQLQVWRLINESLLHNIPVMLMYVVHSAGSSPGRKGFCMAVNLQGKMEGSIGGGIMEHKFVEVAKDALRSGNNQSLLRRQIHDKAAANNQSGMICSGEQTIFLYTVKQEDKKHIENLIACLESNKHSTLILSHDGLYLENNASQEDYVFTHQTDNDWLYKERLGYKNTLYIIGAGHCSLMLSKIMSMMDFYIHLYDDRHGLNTFHQNDYVHEKTIVDDYHQLQNIITPGDNSYVVVMTFGYRTDDIVIRALLGKSFKYLGVLGSMSKMNKMFADYKTQGIEEEQLRKIYSPIGLQINSQTPEEIAISIAAEIIQVKNYEQ